LIFKWYIWLHSIIEFSQYIIYGFQAVFGVCLCVNVPLLFWLYVCESNVRDCVDADDDTEVDDSPIEQVRLTVSTTDDPTQPALTFRTWVIGLACCIVLAFVNQFFGYRTNPLTITAVSAQIVSLPIGKLMAATLPTTIYKVPFTKWSFTLNPGPFNLKEHALITIFASAGAGGVYAIYIVNVVKAFYHRSINPIAAFLLAITTQVNNFVLLNGKHLHFFSIFITNQKKL